MNFELKKITLLIFTDIDGTFINNDTFQNLDFAKDYLEEIQNYHDNYIIDNNSSTNQILQVVNALDKYMNKIENTHKYVVQLCKIYNDY